MARDASTRRSEKMKRKEYEGELRRLQRMWILPSAFLYHECSIEGCDQTSPSSSFWVRA